VITVDIPSRYGISQAESAGLVVCFRAQSESVYNLMSLYAHVSTGSGLRCELHRYIRFYGHRVFTMILGWSTCFDLVTWYRRLDSSSISMSTAWFAHVACSIVIQRDFWFGIACF